MIRKPAGVILAFDYGLQHIGVATGQTITGSATGLTTVRAKNGKPMWRQIDPLIADYEPFMLIVGLPLNMDDTETELCDRARGFAQGLHQRYALPVEMQDERLTTRSAMEQLATAQAIGVARTDHEMAACLIAEQWLSQY